MPVAVTSLKDISHWARSNLLEIVMLIAGAILLSRAVRWTGERVIAHIDAQPHGGDALVRSEDAKHRHALAEVVTWAIIVLIAIVTSVLVLERFGVPLASLIAPATVVGVAVGFGAQRVVQDLLAGVFMIAERQYGFGDLIRISPLGATTGVTGTVEEFTLRITQIRTINGEVVIIPNGQIQQVTNLSRDWARAVIDVPVPASVDVGHAIAILRKAGSDAFDDPDLRPLLLDPPTVMGVESIDVNTFSLRMVARTLPGKQFEVGAALRTRVAKALLDAGITVTATDAGTSSA
ncbi:MAG TPA: mechanosensitive ion channel family protein [Acidimicrobiales bacterium]|nr:mechanosensitive ion channel family protein [Acidimicrobiales bacterium]